MTDRSGAPEGTPSVPVIFYLFADRIVPKHPMLVEGTSIPCTEVRVQKGALAVRLLSSAFWSLRQQGVIEIEVAESPPARRMLRRADVGVSLLKRAERPGLEGTVLASLEDRETVHDVICRWSELGSTDPWHDVIAEVVSEAVANGLIREVEASGGVLTKLLGTMWGSSPSAAGSRHSRAGFSSWTPPGWSSRDGRRPCTTASSGSARGPSSRARSAGTRSETALLEPLLFARSKRLGQVAQLEPLLAGEIRVRVAQLDHGLHNPAPFRLVHRPDAAARANVSEERGAIEDLHHVEGLRLERPE
jgi:hypothetical protein